MRVQMPRWMTFGRLARIMTIALGSIVAAALAGTPATAADKPVTIVALGDSLTAGLGLAAKDAFPARLQAALAAKGIVATIADAGVSGDTTSGGLARLDWSVPPGTEGVILELGANDALRGLDPKVPRASLDAILQRLTARGIPVLLCGMLSPPNLGADYARAFNAIYADLAESYGTLLYPFFLDGVVGNRRLVQGDGLHPTAAGVDLIVAKILPDVEALIARVRAKRGP